MKGRRQFLVLGHPRSGTAYAAWVLRQCGYDVGHERMGAHGTASWMFAVHNGPYPFTFDGSYRGRFKFEQVIHIVREPLAAIASILHTEQGSEDFRSRYVNLYGTPMEKAVQSYLGWNKLIAAGRVDLLCKTESLAAHFGVTATPSERVNAREHPALTMDEISEAIAPALAFELQKFVTLYTAL